jgi:eukaryotic-like serine/threonine-protein kinase
VEARWGKCLGRYELVAELGRGAMGVVYKARDPRIDRFVALKTINLVGASPEEALEYRERFFQEAQAVGRLVHPGIVTVFDVGEEPESRTPYIVMEYVDGPSLNALLSEKGGKLPLETALQLTEQLAEALDCAHGQGVVHRDIKPANILVNSNGQAKITDFGIAKLNLAHLTLPGHVLGTPAYMSPEQLNGDPLDGRSDLFSLGVILYNMVSGYRPFQGNSVTTVCFKLANHDPLPPSAMDPDLPHGVDAIILRAMAKDPAERYQRGLEFALDVRELKERLSNNGVREQTAVRAKTTGSRSSNARADAMQHVLQRATEWSGSARRSIVSHLRTTWRIPARQRLAAIVVIAFGTMVFAISWHRESYGPVQAPLQAPQNNVVASFSQSGKAMAAPSAQAINPTPTGRAVRTAVAKPKSTSHTGGATLLIGIDYPFEDGTVSVLSDSRVVYSQALKGESKKRLGLFRTVEGRDLGTIHLGTGEHQLGVHVQSSAAAYDELKTVAIEVGQGQTRTLQISFHGHHKDMHLDLR